MNSLWFIPAIMSVFGGMGEYNAGKDMIQLGRQQELQTEENALLEKRELEESVRRQEIKDKQALGSARAKMAASGARLEGSVGGYLDFIEDEQSLELKWMKTAGESRIRLNRQAGLTEAQATRIQGKAKKFGLFTGIATGFSILGQGGLFEKTN